VEGSSFIAGPSCALHLQQMGARVIRFDMIGGGPDYQRWPLAPSGKSLYWEGLNKGKLSIAIDLTCAEGRELAVAIVTAKGENRGLFVTNYPAGGFLSQEALAQHREDLITLRVMGWPNGRNAVDYTVNAAVGMPFLTGNAGLPDAEPVNSVLPAWDLLTGAYGAFALLAAERRRRQNGKGGEIRVALSDVAVGALGHLGQIAETIVAGDRPRGGNALFGAFGRDFATQDGQRVMLVGITTRQWSGLVKALGIADAVAVIETDLGVSFASDEGQRYAHRARLFNVVARAAASFDLCELAQRLDKAGACWEPYRTLQRALSEDPRLVADNPLFTEVEHPSGLRYPAPGAFAVLDKDDRSAARPAPRLGQHTEMILVEFLGLPNNEIARLYDKGVVAGE
jgi:2-methylfumaryl-CoA isomerase